MDLKTLNETPSWEWPPGAEDFLLSVLRDREAEESDRVVAAWLAGEYPVVNDEIGEALLAIVRDSEEPEELRGAAAISLGPALEDADTDPEEAVISEIALERFSQALRKLYQDGTVPKTVRRRALEASIRAPRNWHRSAIAAAYSSGDRDWKLTAVFAMRWIRGFEKEILESLESGDEEIFFEAVCAAGSSEIESAWPYVADLLDDPGTPKHLLLAAIEAASTIRPDEAEDLLFELVQSEDEDIAETAREAMAMADAITGVFGYEDDDFDR